MKQRGLIFILFLVLQQASFAQEADSITGTFKIKKPVEQPRDTLIYTEVTYPTYKNDNDTGLIPRLYVTKKSAGKNYDDMVTLLIPANVKARSGTVYISYNLDKSGKPENVQLDRGLDPVLDEAALNYVRNMTPKDANGKAPKKKKQRIIPIRFTT